MKGNSMTGFNKLPRILQILLLLIPGVNWIVEIVVRWSTFFKMGGILRLIISILVTVGGLAFGWIDLIFVLFTKHLCLQ